MTPIGETLRRERLRRNLDLGQIADELKISRRMLEAIENEKFDRLPGTIFAKNFVRQYAHLLGLDEDELASEVQQLLEPQPVPPPPPSAPHPDADIPLPRMQQWESVGDAPRFHWAGPLPALALVIVVMLGCSLIYAFWQRSRRPVVVAKPAPATVATAQPQPPAPAPPPPAPAQPQPAPPQGQAQQPPAPEPAAGEGERASMPPDANGPLRVEVTATEPVWVLARSDGKYLFSGTLEANQSRTIEADKDVVLRVGNAGGLSVTLNGKPLPSLGPKGQVRTVQLTSGGFQIVAPPKPAPPSEPL